MFRVGFYVFRFYEVRVWVVVVCFRVAYYFGEVGGRFLGDVVREFC